MNIEDAESIMIDSLCVLIPSIGSALNENIPLTYKHRELLENVVNLLIEAQVVAGMTTKREEVNSWRALRDIARGHKSKTILQEGLEELGIFTNIAEVTFLTLKALRTSNEISVSIREVTERGAA